MATIVDRLLIAEPSLAIQCALVSLNLVIWWSFFKVCAFLVPRALSSAVWYQQLTDEVWTQLPGLAGREACPVKRGGFDTKYGYMVWIFVGIHHGVAGGLILYSNLYSDGGVAFRHGLAMALGGCDILQLLQCAARAEPFHEVKPDNGSIDTVVPLIAHHLFGMIVILPTNLFFSTDPSIQLLAIALLLAAAVSVLIGLVLEPIDPEKPCNQGAQRLLPCYVVFFSLYVLNVCLIVALRWVMYPFQIVPAVTRFWAVNPVLGILGGLAISLLVVFNVAVLVSMVPVAWDLGVGLSEILASHEAGKSAAEAFIALPVSASSKSALRRSTCASPAICPFPPDVSQAAFRSLRASFGQLQSNVGKSDML